MMRLVVLGLALALTASAPLVATAQAPVTTRQLGPNEVLVEINALGVVITRADLARMPITISGTGDTEDAARADAENNAREVRAILRAQGVADADISAQPATSYAVDSMAALNAMEAMVDTNEAMTTDMTASATANVPMEIVVRNVASVAAIQQALVARGYFSLQGVTYSLNDDSGPRRQARAQALQKARADAESYAAALGMRVVRVVRVSERLGLDLLGMMVSESQVFTGLFTPNALRTNGPDVQTMVAVGVDYALAPR